MSEIDQILDDLQGLPSAVEDNAKRKEQLQRERENAAIAHLAKMEPGGDFERERKGIAKKLGWRTSAVDAAVRARREIKAADSTLNLKTPEPWPHPVDGADLLHTLSLLVASFVILPAYGAETLALWILFAHTVDCFDVAPRLAILSAVMRSGKTTLLRIISWLVPRALLASNISPAAVFRVIELARPTLLADEMDTFGRNNEELRGILNSGHDRDAAFVVRCDGEDNTPRRFSTWGALAMAAIGRLSATWIDRSITINLKRRLPNEIVQRITPSCRAGFEELARKCARWAADNAEKLRAADPLVPSELHDRAAQNWRPLLSICDAAGGEWGDLGRKAALTLSGKESADEASLGVMLLSDIQAMFGDQDRMSSENICKALAEMEGRPWPEFGRTRKPITQNQLATTLGAFKIVPHSIRIGDKTPKGYTAADFADAFSRYLQSATTPQLHGENDLDDFSDRNANSNVAGQKEQSTHAHNGCGAVADQNGYLRKEKSFEP